MLKFVVVTVENRETGIVGVHYVEVRPSLLHPEAWASRQEEERGYRVLGARVWNR